MWNQSLIPALIACCKQELMHTVNIRQTVFSLKQRAKFDDLEERVTSYNLKKKNEKFPNSTQKLDW
jgi:hypothetical protein